MIRRIGICFKNGLYLADSFVRMLQYASLATLNR